MFELQNIIGAIGALADLLQGLGGFVLPMAGVGGGIEARESIDVIPIIKFTAIFIGSIGALFGFGLAIAAQKFAIKKDPRVDEVLDVLAHAHCGACGYPGCEQYAEAVVSNPDVAANLCTPGGARTTQAVASITGKVAEVADPFFSRVMCQGSLRNSVKKFRYEGIKDCRAAILAGGGDKACIYGCLGYSTCVAACLFDAITMSEDHLPVIDIGKCTGCKKCAEACPKNVIEILPGAKAVLISCHSKDKGGQTRKNCDVGCIACAKCVKVCPFDAPSIENSLARIDLEKCRVCGLCVSVCSTNAIQDFIPHRPKASVNDKCNGCQICKRICPVDAPSGEAKKMHTIDQSKCIGCGICTARCPKLAIEGTFNTAAVLEAAAAKQAAKEAKAAEAA